MHNFRKIISHSLIVIVFVILILVGIMAPYFYGEKYYYQDYKVRKSLSGKIDTLIIGSSHALRAIKPVILNQELDIKSYNLSSPLMSMYGRYTLFKKEIERNSIKNLIFEISYNALTIDRESLGYEGDLYVLGRLDNTIERIEFIKNAFAPSEYDDLFSDTLERAKNSLLIQKDEIVQYHTFGYLPMPSNNQSLTEEEKKNIFNTEILDSELKDDNLKYFNIIMETCKERGINVILVVVPVTEKVLLEYSNLDDVFSKYVDLAKKYNYKYYDFNLDKKRKELYSEEKSFFDSTHLSDFGADTFSNRLSEILKKDTDGRDVKKEFYNNYNAVKETILK